MVDGAGQTKTRGAGQMSSTHFHDAKMDTRERMRALRQAFADERLERLLQGVEACLPSASAAGVRTLAGAILDKVPHAGARAHARAR